MQAAEIKALARMLDRIDYYRLLKVEPDAPLPAIRSAYHESRRRFHPDSYLSQGPEVREAVDRIARRITEAYLVLRDRPRRTAYDEARKSGALRATDALDSPRDRAVDEKGDPRGTTPNGKRFAGMADDEERRGNLKQALSHLQMALTFEPNNAFFKARIERLRSRI